MQEHDLPAGGADRRVQLRAAAEALVAWVHVQRGSSPRAVDAPMAAVQAPALPVPPVLPVLPVAPVINDAEPEAPPTPKRAPRPKAPPWLWPWIAGQARAIAPPLLRWSWRLGAVAALAVVVLVGGARAWPYARAGWPAVQTSAQTYWSKLTDALKSGTEVPGSVPDSNASAGVTSTGSLQVQSDPAGARVLVDGQLRGVTPLTVDDLSAGSHVVTLESARGSVRKTVAVAAGSTTQVSEGIFAGWIRVSAPFELLVSEGGRGMRLDARNEVLLPPGSHTLLFENRDLGYRETRRVEITPGGTTAVSLAPPASTLTVTATLPAEVLVDGARAGSAPLVDHAVRLGTRDVIVRSDSGVERQFTVTVTVKPVRIDVDFSKP